MSFALTIHPRRNLGAFSASQKKKKKKKTNLKTHFFSGENASKKLTFFFFFFFFFFLRSVTETLVSPFLFDEVSLDPKAKEFEEEYHKLKLAQIETVTDKAVAALETCFLSHPEARRNPKKKKKKNRQKKFAKFSFVYLSF